MIDDSKMKCSRATERWRASSMVSSKLISQKESDSILQDEEESLVDGDIFAQMNLADEAYELEDFEKDDLYRNTSFYKH